MSDAHLVRESVALAEDLARRAGALETRAERRKRRSLGRVVTDPDAIALTARLLDRSLRPSRPERAARLVADATSNRPPTLGVTRRALLGAFGAAWLLAPSTAMGLVRMRLRAETAGLVHDAGPAAVSSLLEAWHGTGVAVNLNPIGEAVLSDAEARTRFATLASVLADRRVDAVSVKASALTANMHPLAGRAVTTALVGTLRELYDLAGPRLVALDMEEFRDLEPTLAAFTTVMNEPRYLRRTHGIALQAYLPESGAALTELATLGARRLERGGAPIRVRIVKGANLAAERLDAALHGWAPAPLPDKAAVDANMKRLVGWALDPARVGIIVGVGSHNVFDVAFALTRARAYGTTERLTIEMLAGMADPLLRAVAEIAPSVLVYAPIAARDDFPAAVAYLVRRLAEQTSEGNFLRHAFSMSAGDHEWQRQRDGFRAACATAASEPAPRVPPRRSAPNRGPPAATDAHAPFANVADTDWTVAANRSRLAAALARATLPPLPPAAPLEAVDAAVVNARADPDGWADRPLRTRREALCRAAGLLERQRFDLLALMAFEANKPPREGDVEVSEAIDLCTYYARALDDLDGDPAVSMSPRGVVAVVPPWNFPLAIPLGGAVATLIGGNRVVLKPSPFTVRTALAGARALWDAGVPRSALTVVHTDPQVAAALTAHPDVDAVVFTGSTSTARRILQSRAGRHVVAEAGGKNAIVVTDAADRDLAIRDILTSAFSYSGQKCSAASLVVAEAAVFDDHAFRRRLVDAVATLRTGAAIDAATDIAPLVTDPNPALDGVYRRLDAGEWWALEPRTVGPGHRTPAVVWDVQAGSAAHVAELFGPVVGVMRVRDLDEAIAAVHTSGYGLMSGLQSLDEDEWRHWLAGIDAGNLYVNRPTTGAVVGRQPFGGWAMSGYGPGAKAGGRNYAAQLVRIVPTRPLVDVATYPSGTAPEPVENASIRGQANISRWLPATDVVLRHEVGDDPRVVAARLGAAATAGCRVDVSSPDTETIEALCARLDGVSRVVLCGSDVPDALGEQAARTWTWICSDAVTGTHRDLLPFLREQTVSVDLHRYGWVPPGVEVPL